MSYTSRLLSKVVRPALGLGNSIRTCVPDDVQPVFLSQHPPDLRTQTWDPTVQLNLNCLPGDTHSLCFNVSYVTDGSVSWGTLNTGLHSKIPGTALASTFILSQVQWIEDESWPTAQPTVTPGAPGLLFPRPLARTAGPSSPVSSPSSPAQLSS